MRNLTAKIELLADVATVAVTILLSVILVKFYLPPAQNQPLAFNASATRKATDSGEPVNLPGINWQKNGKTLLLTLSSTCHFCTGSAPFYRRLGTSSGAHLVAVMPQTVDEAQTFLDKMGVAIGDIRQLSLASMNVAGTPTLLLVDDAGRVSGEWVGKLTPEQESEVLDRVRVGTDGPR